MAKANLSHSPDSPARQTMIGQSKYRIIGLIGQGQFGRVFFASNRHTGELVALKELSHERSPTHKFLRELLSLMTLQHPNIVTGSALEHTATGRYLVMDYCDGGTLRNLLEQDSSLRLCEGLQLILGILAGLDEAHRQGIVHCDIKPENILLTLHPAGWTPRLSDFGVALRLTPPAGKTRAQSEPSADATVGSPAYMAPERFYGLYSASSDLYAVGIILWEMLTGERPFTGVPGKLMWAHMNQRLQLPDAIPHPLRAIVQKSLEKLPARRFASAADMATALQQAIDDPEVRAVSNRRIPLQNAAKPAPGQGAAPVRALPGATKKVLPAPLTFLQGCGNTLYAALGAKVRVWRSSGQPPVSAALPARAEGLLPLPQGCLASAGGQIYWLGAGETARSSLLQLGDKASDFPCQMAADSESRWLAVASAGSLGIYSLPALLGGAPRLPVRTIPLSEDTPPELIFLDRRHLLAVWQDAAKPLTRFRIYTRRGTRAGELSVPVAFRSDFCGRYLVPAGEPFTLFGIEDGSNFSARGAAALRIQLRPLLVTRIPLDIVPVCWAVIPGGCVLASDSGKIVFLDDLGRRAGTLKGPPAPVAIAGWGGNGLAIATRAGKRDSLYFLSIDKGATDSHPRA
ncbi:serine/threonine-protein kinase [Kamptonema formosum]|uniref:serine/threonine-protein kinase n=1 Tax=Kamptonema formosum TaxID=331992 RepID=UPI00034DAE02|nr:serine/threonine-protein kinase [Oscillatoria sp. PCC 10802]